MEFRKLISFGKSSYVLSVPGSWIKKNKLKKGDLVHVTEGAHDLIVTASTENEANEPKSITIEVKEDSNLKIINRQITTAYILSYNIINIIGEGVSKNSSQIRSMIHNLVAMEIMEQTTDRIVAKDFLNMGEINISNLIRRIDLVVRTMIKDLKCAQENRYTAVYQRDEDVNRLSFLVYRAVKHALNKPIMAKLYKLDSCHLLDTWRLVDYIERIADIIKRIARILEKEKLDEDVAREFNQILEGIEKHYLESMKAYYSNDEASAYKLSSARDKILAMCDKFYEKNRTLPWGAELVDDLKDISRQVHDLGRVIYG